MGIYFGSVHRGILVRELTMTKIFALFPLLDLTSLIGTRNFSVLDLRSVNTLIDPVDTCAENLPAFLQNALDRTSHEIILIDFDPPVLRRISSTMIDQVVIVAPASSIPARVYLDTVVRHSTLSQATVSHFHQDYPLYLKYADEAEEDFPSIRLRGIKELLHVPGYGNRNISLAKELENLRKGYKFVEHRPTKKQRRLSEHREVRELVTSVWVRMKTSKEIWYSM